MKEYEYRNKPGYGPGGIYLDFARILVTIRKYFVKLMFKPKIVEKEIEVEKIVERLLRRGRGRKIVEKIVEKPVVEEKIVYQKVEVPREIIKKVYVHVPFPTDDQEIFKERSIIHNEDDEDKK